MAAIIPGYEYDIFISYRQNDNKRDGWVTEFIQILTDELEATVKEKISIYFDENPFDGLGETHDVDDSLAKKLRCIIFIPIISKTYCDPNSFAWTNEFLAFNELAHNDEFGIKVSLPNGNTASRVLPIRIHDIIVEDKKLVEDEIGFLRSIDFVYQSAGVNRPLLANEDDPSSNLNKTYYRDQINKVANAIQEIIYGIRTANETEALIFNEADKPHSKKPKLTSEIKRRNVLRASLVYALMAALLWKVVGVVGLSSNIMSIVPLVLVILFPFAVLMAWLYERSPQGFIRTGSAASSDNPFSDPQKKPLTSNTFILLLTATVVTLFFIYPQVQPNRTADKEVIEKSIAVLPFRDISADGDQAYFSEGIAEEILNALDQIPELRVAGRSSSFALSAKGLSDTEIANFLNVTTLLQGSVRKSHNRIRVNAQLINASDGFQIWSEQFDRTIDDIFAIQDEIARAISEKLKITLSASNVTLAPELTKNQKAYEYYLQANYFSHRPPEGTAKAIELLNLTIKEDPSFAKAYDRMAWALIWQAFAGVKTSKEAFEEAQPFIEKSIKLGFQKPYIGYYIYYKWDWEKARGLLSKYSTISKEYIDYYTATGNYDSAIVVNEERITTNPLDIIGQVVLLLNYGLNGDIEKGDMQITLLEKLFSAYSITHTRIAIHLLVQGEIDRARPYIKKSDELSGSKGYSILLNAIIRTIDGEEQKGYDFIEDVKQGKYGFDPNWAIANMYYFLEKDELVLDFLEKAVADHEFECVFLVSPLFFSRVYDHPRYKVLLDSMNFPKK